ncbi:MAG: SMC-Scp complex subunit ScpB [Chloroflexi bacterium]|nr:SMC-Scp complex subunit ScpB [Chloroflexota bacterium]
MTDNFAKREINVTEARVEALLFVASGPTTASQIGEVLSIPTTEIESALHFLQIEYEKKGGLGLQVHSGRYQLTTSPNYSQDIEKFLGIESVSHLSRAGIETLAIISYKQPITRPGIDLIRGVSSDGVIKSLLSKGLIQEVGRADGPGRPILFSTTVEFLQHFGLSSLEQLPPYELSNDSVDSNKIALLKD